MPRLHLREDNMLDHSVIGIIAGIVAFAANPPYIWAILKGTTKPDRVTWWILAGLNVLIFASSYALGAWDTLWLPLGYAISFGIIAILSLKYGEGDFQLSGIQQTCVAGAVLAVFVWWFSGSALFALGLTIAIDFFGIVPTIYKSYMRPWHEDKIAWGIAFLASILYIGAIETWTFSIAAYPVYLLITNGILAFLIIIPRRVPA